MSDNEKASAQGNVGFTPGPWTVEGVGCVAVIHDYGEPTVVTVACCTVHTQQRSRNDARLIAAAPEMYEVLRQIQSLRDRDESGEGFSDDEGEDVIGIVDDLLAKIDG